MISELRHAKPVISRDLAPTLSKHLYRPEIDGLRALAVSAVIVNHFSSSVLPSGYLGVDIFFVISGFVITASLYKYECSSLREFALKFYVRRIKRVVPALLLFIFIAGILICLVTPNPAFSLTTGVAAAFGASNLYLFRESTDYFADTTELNVFGHTWSLGVEEQFYLIFPFILWWARENHRKDTSARTLCWIIGALALVSLVAFGVLYRTDQSAAYFLMPTRLWELGTGCLLFVGLEECDVFKRSLMRIPPLLPAAGLVILLFVSARFAVSVTIAVVFLTAVLIACLRSGTIGYDILTSRPAVFAGLISYSLYLWHWGVLSLSRWTIGVHWWSAPGQLAAIWLLALVSYRYVERPLRNAQWSAVGEKSIWCGLGACVGVAGCLVVLANLPEGSLYASTFPPTVELGVQSLTDKYELPDKSSTWDGAKCSLTDNKDVGKVISIPGCTLGNFYKARHRVLVIGNSFSAAFAASFDKLVMFDKYSVTITSSFGSSPVPEILNSTSWDKANAYYWKEVIPSLVSQLRDGDWVFLVSDLSGWSPEVPAGEVGRKITYENDKSLVLMDKGLSRLSAELAKTGIRLAVMWGTGFAREAKCNPILGARQWFGAACHFLSKEQTLLRREKLNTILYRLQAKGVVRIVDLTDVFCPGTVCDYLSRDGQLLYRDQFAHPSVEAARLSSPLIRKALVAR